MGRDHGGMYLSTSSSFSLDDVLLLVSSSAVACVLKRHDGILLEVSVEEGKIANAEEHCRGMLCIEGELSIVFFFNNFVIVILNYCSPL